MYAKRTGEREFLTMVLQRTPKPAAENRRSATVKVVEFEHIKMRNCPYCKKHPRLKIVDGKYSIRCGQHSLATYPRQSLKEAIVAWDNMAEQSNEHDQNSAVQNCLFN